MTALCSKDFYSEIELIEDFLLNHIALGRTYDRYEAFCTFRSIYGPTYKVMKGKSISQTKFSRMLTDYCNANGYKTTNHKRLYAPHFINNFKIELCK